MNLNRRTYLKFFHDFDRLFQKLDEIPDIEFERSSNRSVPLKKKSQTPLKSPKLSYIITELKRRIQSTSGKNSASFSSGRFKIRSQTDDRVGPGSYSLRSAKPTSESHHFSTAPRLKTPISHNILNIGTLYPVKESTSNEIILKNKLVSVSPDVVRSKKVSLQLLEKTREEMIKDKKRQIDLKNKTSKENRLKRKIQMFEWRRLRPEIQMVQKAWSIFDVVCGFLTVLVKKGRVKKQLKSRWEVLLSHFVVISKVVARIMKRLKTIREKFLEKNLLSLSLPIEDFLRSRVAENKKMIQNLLIDYSELPLISKLMVKVKFSILTLQRSLRNHLEIKKARISALRKQWHKLYKQLIKESPDRASSIERIGAIKKEMIDKYTSRYLASVILEHSEAFRHFLQSYLENYTTINTSWFHSNKPKLNIFRQSGKIQKLIEQAIKSKDSHQKKQRYLKYLQTGKLFNNN